MYPRAVIYDQISFHVAPNPIILQALMRMEEHVDKLTSAEKCQTRLIEFVIVFVNSCLEKHPYQELIQTASSNNLQNMSHVFILSAESLKNVISLSFDGSMIFLFSDSLYEFFFGIATKHQIFSMNFPIIGKLTTYKPLFIFFHS